MPTPYGSRGGMAFGAAELRVVRRALALAAQPGPTGAGDVQHVQDVQDCRRLAESLDEAMREAARLRAFLVADLARYRAALPGTVTGYLTLLDEVLAAGHHPEPDDLAALRALCGNPTAATLLHRCHRLTGHTLPPAIPPSRTHPPAIHDPLPATAAAPAYGRPSSAPGRTVAAPVSVGRLPALVGAGAPVADGRPSAPGEGRTVSVSAARLPAPGDGRRGAVRGGRPLAAVAATCPPLGERLSTAPERVPPAGAGHPAAGGGPAAGADRVPAGVDRRALGARRRPEAGADRLAAGGGSRPVVGGGLAVVTDRRPRDRAADPLPTGAGWFLAGVPAAAVGGLRVVADLRSASGEGAGGEPRRKPAERPAQRPGERPSERPGGKPGPAGPPAPTPEPARRPVPTPGEVFPRRKPTPPPSGPEREREQGPEQEQE